VLTPIPKDDASLAGYTRGSIPGFGGLMAGVAVVMKINALDRHPRKDGFHNYFEDGE
jgi:hypothetical protein